MIAAVDYIIVLAFAKQRFQIVSYVWLRSTDAVNP